MKRVWEYVLLILTFGIIIYFLSRPIPDREDNNVEVIVNKEQETIDSLEVLLNNLRGADRKYYDQGGTNNEEFLEWDSVHHLIPDIEEQLKELKR